MESSVLTNDLIDKYNTSATICGKVYKKLKDLIITNQERNISLLCKIGNELIISELSSIYKKNKDKHVAFPINISLNNIISNYTGSGNIIDTDIVKIKLGVSLCGCISMLTETFVIKENKSIEKIIKVLNKIQNDILDVIKDEETVDEVRIFVESKCITKSIFPIANCISYQQEQSFIKTLDSKYMILNHVPYYDINGYITNEENTNFEFDKDDIFTINITVIPTEDDIEPNQVKYKDVCDPTIYRLNESKYLLKLKSSRDFYNKIKNTHSNYAFQIDKYIENPKDKMGMSECLKNNLLETYKIITPHNNLPVISKEFTIIVGKHSSKTLLYKLD